MIYVIGEALIDIIVDAEGTVLASVVGGAPLNTARTISRLDVSASFLGGISTDAFGNRMVRLLADDGVHYALGSQVPEPTTLAIAELDENGAATYRFVMDNTSATAVTPDAALAAIGSDCRAVHAGTLGLVLQPLADAARAVVESSPDDRLVMIDPNCRPSVMDSSAVFTRTLDAVLARADIVKVSGDDLAFISPALDAKTAAQELQRESGALVLFTDGAKSVHVITAAETVVLEVPKVNVVDTVGAGDSFSGGFLAHWLGRGLGRSDLRDLAAVVEAATFGIKVAGITCQRAGADPPRSHELPAR
ncbi:MAG: carbohydrate kinase [Candidatus Nanopelagicales bacterium]|nr:carbohydrate kinase [Candidatus Nanopelagicales bacterium]